MSVCAHCNNKDFDCPDCRRRDIGLDTTKLEARAMSNEAREYFVLIANGGLSDGTLRPMWLLKEQEALDTAAELACKGVKCFVTKRIATAVPSSYFELAQGEAL